MKAAIFINSLAIRTKIGINPEELKKKQTIILDIVIYYNQETVLKSDHIEDSIDYDDIAIDCKQFAKKNQFSLVETFAYQFAKFIFVKYAKSEKVKIKISKTGSIKNSKAYGSKLTITREDFKLEKS